LISAEVGTKAADFKALADELELARQALSAASTYIVLDTSL
jgi:hypothetical protein